jgi:tryptophan 7-halogenase
MGGQWHQLVMFRFEANTYDQKSTVGSSEKGAAQFFSRFECAAPTFLPRQWKSGASWSWGAGSAGLMAAPMLKRKLRALNVRVVRSPDIGIIGVGEGTAAVFPRHFFEYLKMKPGTFYEEAEPTWKMASAFSGDGGRSSTTPSPSNLNAVCRKFAEQRLLLHWWISVARQCLGVHGAWQGISAPSGWPAAVSQQSHVPHREQEARKLAGNRCRENAVEIIDATVTPETGGEGIAALMAEDGRRITADLYIDASGFRSELLGLVLQEPSELWGCLFCDRAVTGGWTRAREPILPYTTAETMDSGWCWQIEHEHLINRGYVYSSRAISKDATLEEFLRKNPKVATPPRVVKFRSGRYRRSWVGNVVAVGNSAGLVEPLEATALQVICVEVSTLAVARVCDRKITVRRSSAGAAARAPFGRGRAARFLVQPGEAGVGVKVDRSGGRVCGKARGKRGSKQNRGMSRALGFYWITKFQH